MHTKISGVADYLAENDEHAIEILRNLVNQINIQKMFCAIIEIAQHVGLSRHQDT